LVNSQHPPLDHLVEPARLGCHVHHVGDDLLTAALTAGGAAAETAVAAEAATEQQGNRGDGLHWNDMGKFTAAGMDSTNAVDTTYYQSRHESGAERREIAGKQV
jgi:hypothetical protein